MTEEIKEILIDNIKNEIETTKEKDFALCIEQWKQLLDYITNLQQENERLNNKIKEQNLLLIEFQDMEQKVDIYKSRCEKAIEYIKFVINHYKEQLETPIEDTYFDSDVNRKGYILSIIAYLQTTLDTLNGSDEE